MSYYKLEYYSKEYLDFWFMFFKSLITYFVLSENVDMSGFCSKFMHIYVQP